MRARRERKAVGHVVVGVHDVLKAGNGIFDSGDLDLPSPGRAASAEMERALGANPPCGVAMIEVDDGLVREMRSVRERLRILLGPQIGDRHARDGGEPCARLRRVDVDASDRTVVFDACPHKPLRRGRRRHKKNDKKSGTQRRRDFMVTSEGAYPGKQLANLAKRSGGCKDSAQGVVVSFAFSGWWRPREIGTPRAHWSFSILVISTCGGMADWSKRT